MCTEVFQNSWIVHNDLIFEGGSGESKPHEGNATAAYWNMLQRTWGLYHKPELCGETVGSEADKGF